MKIVYIVNSRIPTEKAHGIQIAKMCEAFADLKTQVELIIPRRFNRIKEDIFNYYDIKRNFKIKKLPCLDLIPLDKFLGRLSFWTESLTFSISVFLYLLFKNTEFIYSRDFLPLFFLSFFKKNIFYEMHDFPSSLQKIFCQITFKKVNGIIATNEWKKNQVQKVFDLREDKILKAFNGVDIGKFDLKETKSECRKKLGLAQDKKIILYTGHLYSWKGADILAEASRYLPEEIEIYFVGGTISNIEKFRNQNSGFRVHIIEHRSHSEIPYWLKSADVLVLPNTAKQDISRCWTSPLKMFEYMVSKRPIVASDIVSLREILNSQNSLLVEADNPIALARGIKKILQHSDLAGKLFKQAFEDVQQYAWIKRAEKVLNFITISVQ